MSIVSVAPTVESWLQRSTMLTANVRVWCTLHGNRLAIRAGPSGAKEIDGVTIRSLQRQGKEIFTVGHGFGGMGEWTFRADSEATQAMWVDAITEALTSAKSETFSMSFCAEKRSLWAHAWRPRHFVASGADLAYYEAEGKPARGRFVVTAAAPVYDPSDSVLTFSTANVEVAVETASREPLLLRFRDARVALQYVRLVRAALAASNELRWSPFTVDASPTCPSIAALGRLESGATVLVPPPAPKMSASTADQQAIVKAAAAFVQAPPPLILFGGSNDVSPTVGSATTDTVVQALRATTGAERSSNAVHRVDLGGKHPVSALGVKPFVEDRGVHLAPPPRRGHAMTSTSRAFFVHGGLACVDEFATDDAGGRRRAVSVLSDFWTVQYSRSAELAWVPLGQQGTAPLLPPRHHHTLSVLPIAEAKNQLLLVGGIDAEGHARRDVLCLDFVKREATLIDALTVPRAGHSAVALQGGLLLVVGGYTDTASGPALPLVEALSPRTRRWGVPAFTGAPLPPGPAWRPATAEYRGDAFVLLQGGLDQRVTACAAKDKYTIPGNPLLFRLSPCGAMGAERVQVRFYDTRGAVPRPVGGQTLAATRDSLGAEWLYVLGTPSGVEQAPSAAAEPPPASSAWGLLGGLGRAVSSAAKTVATSVSAVVAGTEAGPLGGVRLLLPVAAETEGRPISEKPAAADSDDDVLL